MITLGIETSCDDTALAVLKDDSKLLAIARDTQGEHANWGGVVPELAARLHTENWPPVLQTVLKEANITLQDIDLIAVTQGPGLQTSLLTGTTLASTLGLLFNIPIIPVHHILGHIVSTQLPDKQNQPAHPIKFPCLVMTVSGGHTQFHYQTKDSIEVVGTTRDDACGEAYDKVARMLHLGHPGGPVITKLSYQGDPDTFDMPLVALEKGTLDMSFSGLKSAVRRLIEKECQAYQLEDIKDHKNLETFQANLSACFQKAVEKIFLLRLKRALEKYPNLKQVHFVGGVSANTPLREAMTKFLTPKGINLLVPQEFEYCTDNAAMIALAGYQLHQKNHKQAKVQLIEARPRMDLIL